MNKHINFDNIRLMYGCPIVDWREIDKDLVVKNEEEEENEQDNDTTKEKNVLIRKKENE